MNARTSMRNLRPGQLTTIIIAVLLLAAAVSCGPGDSQSSEQPTPGTTGQQESPATPLPTPTAEAPLPTPTAEAPPPTAVVEAPLPAGWLTHTNQRCEYAISYPPEIQVASQDRSSLIVAFSPDSPGRGATNFVYVSVIDQEDPTMGEEIIYNYDPAETETLLNMQVGESKALRDIADVAPYFTYERLPDTTIGGHDAQTYENVQPWEFPEGTKEIRYVLTLNGCTYLIGGYLDAAGSNEPGAISEELFNQIVATVQLGS